MMKLVNLFSLQYRLIYLVIWGFFISTIHQIEILVILNCLALFWLGIQIGIYRQRYRCYLLKWLRFHVFTLFLFATLSLQIDHTGISFHQSGMILALILSLRINLLAFSLWIVMMNVAEQHLLQAITQLPFPKKLQQLFILTVRYVAVLGEVNRNIGIAMKARGFHARCDKRSFYVLSQRVALLLIHALNKVEITQNALKARGLKF